MMNINVIWMHITGHNFCKKMTPTGIDHPYGNRWPVRKHKMDKATDDPLGNRWFMIYTEKYDPYRNRNEWMRKWFAYNSIRSILKCFANIWFKLCKNFKKKRIVGKFDEVEKKTSNVISVGEKCKWRMTITLMVAIMIAFMWH